jgi:AcrR family transcriptional regulator
VVDETQQGTRQRLVADAFAVFARHGYRVPIRRLATELGVTTGAIYHHFGSKEGLFLAVLRSTVEADAAEFPAVPPELGVRERVRLLMAAVESREQFLLRRALLLEEYVRRRENGLPEELVTGMTEYAAAVSKFLGSDDPDVGRFVLSLISGVLRRRHLDEGNTRWDRMGAILEDALVGRLGG